MANELDNTTQAAEIPEQWRPRFISRFYDANKVLPRVLNVTEDFKGKGDIAHITVEGFDLTVNDVGSDGSLTVQQQTLTDVSVTIDAYKDVTNEWIGKTREQAFGLWEQQFPKSAGDAVRQKIESDILALYTGATLAAQGDGLGYVGEDELLGALNQFLDNKLPLMENPDDFTIVLDTKNWAPLKKLKLLDYDQTGEAGEGGAATQKIGKLWNVPVIFSTQCTSTGGIRKGLAFHKTAMAWAVQRNVTPRFADRLAAAKDSYIGAVTALYGVDTVVGARMCVINSKA